MFANSLQVRLPSSSYVRRQSSWNKHHVSTSHQHYSELVCWDGDEWVVLGIPRWQIWKAPREWSLHSCRLIVPGILIESLVIRFWNDRFPPTILNSLRNRRWWQRPGSWSTNALPAHLPLPTCGWSSCGGRLDFLWASCPSCTYLFYWYTNIYKYFITIGLGSIIYSRWEQGILANILNTRRKFHFDKTVYFLIFCILDVFIRPPARLAFDFEEVKTGIFCKRMRIIVSFLVNVCM